MKLPDVHKSSMESASVLTGYYMARFVSPTELIRMLNKAEVKELGELVYPGGGAEVLEIIRRVRAGEKLQL
jgi:hypothetical protein